MTRKMRALVLTQPNSMRVMEVDFPSVGEKEVLVKVDCVGICYTDVLVSKGVHKASNLPITLGHEFAGIVAEVGASVSRFQPGDRVMSRSAWACGRCSFCRAGSPANCESREHLGITLDGAFAEFVKVPAEVVSRIGDNTSFADAQSSTTVAGVVRATRRSGLSLGDTAAIVGAGNVGLIQLQASRLSGAQAVDVLDMIDYRLEVARRLGARNVFNVNQDWKSRVLESTGGVGYDVAFDAAGTPSSLATAVHCARKGGTVLVVGGSKTPVTDLVGWDIVLKELTIVAAFGPDGGFPAMLAALDSKSIHIEPLISHHLSLDEAMEGIAMMDRGDPNALRIVIHP